MSKGPTFARGYSGESVVQKRPSSRLRYGFLRRAGEYGIAFRAGSAQKVGARTRNRASPIWHVANVYQPEDEPTSSERFTKLIEL